jgi:hypothetical protein
MAFRMGFSDSVDPDDSHFQRHVEHLLFDFDIGLNISHSIPENLDYLAKIKHDSTIFMESQTETVNHLGHSEKFGYVAVRRNA